MNRLTLGDTVVRRPRPGDTSGHDLSIVEALKAKAADYSIWAIPQTGGAWGLLLDGVPEDWTWHCADTEAAVAKLRELAEIVAAMEALLDQHDALEDLLRAPGGTPLDGSDDDDPQDGGAQS